MVTMMVTGVKWLPYNTVSDQFISVSTDHRMNVWSIDKKKITLQSSCIVHVADVAAMEIIR